MIAHVDFIDYFPETSASDKYFLKCGDGICEPNENCPIDCNLLKCPSSYPVICVPSAILYKNGCVQCSPNCLKCKSKNKCAICDTKNGFLNIKGKCQKKCGKGQFFQQEKSKCKKCHHYCKTCTGQAENECTSCFRDWYKSDEKTKIFSCLNSCPNNCKKCDKTGNCLSCGVIDKITYYLHDQKCTEICLPNLYKNNNLFKCIKCHSTCKTCFGTNKDNCESCIMGKFLYEFQCVDQCQKNIGIFENTLKNKCTNCGIAHCIECYLKGKCIKCQKGMFLLQNKCSNQCSQGYFIDEKNSKCEKCHESCKTCISQSYQDCKSCKKGSFLFVKECAKNQLCMMVGECKVSCPVNYFNNKKMAKCQKCSEKCDSCTGNSKNQCLTCKNSFYLLKNQCRDNCPANFYFTDIVNQICVQCIDKNCLNCINSAKNCDVCKHSFYKIFYQSKIYVDEYNYKCVINCPLSYFKTKKICQKCHSTCLTCKGESNNHCQSCIKNLFFLASNSTKSLGKCVSTCSKHYFLDKITNTCLLCHLSCHSCYGEFQENCTACSNGYKLKRHMCTNLCNTNQYLNNNNITCQNCHSTCLTCKSKKKFGCITCPLGIKMLYSKNCLKNCTGQCLGTCPKNYFTKNDICLTCNKRCDQCIGPTSSDCKSCSKSYYFYQSQCLKKCPKGFYSQNYQCKVCDKKCSSCIDAKNCVSCIDGLLLQLGQCNYQCDKGFYEKNNQCKQCNSFCNTCLNKKICMSCNKGQFLLKGKCQYSCGTRYFKDNGVCRNCISNCILCADSQSCLKCQKPLLLKENASCVYNCGDGYYLSNEVCSNCYRTCKTCIDSSKYSCLTCIKQYALKDNICESNCDVGTFLNKKNLICQNCPSKCLECNKENNCLLCDTGFCLHDKKCLKSCPQSYICQNQKCQQMCQKEGFFKENNSKCKKICSKNLFYEKKSRKCVEECQFNQFKDMKTQMCVNCKENNMALEEDHCVVNCSKGHYIQIANKLSNGVCQKCQNCDYCSGKLEDHCETCNNMAKFTWKSFSSMSLEQRQCKNKKQDIYNYVQLVQTEDRRILLSSESSMPELQLYGLFAKVIHFEKEIKLTKFNDFQVQSFNKDCCGCNYINKEILYVQLLNSPSCVIKSDLYNNIKLTIEKADIDDNQLKKSIEQILPAQFQVIISDISKTQYYKIQIYLLYSKLNTKSNYKEQFKTINNEMIKVFKKKDILGNFRRLDFKTTVGRMKNKEIFQYQMHFNDKQDINEFQDKIDNFSFEQSIQKAKEEQNQYVNIYIIIIALAIFLFIAFSCQILICIILKKNKKQGQQQNSLRDSYMFHQFQKYIQDQTLQDQILNLSIRKNQQSDNQLTQRMKESMKESLRLSKRNSVNSQFSIKKGHRKKLTYTKQAIAKINYDQNKQNKIEQMESKQESEQSSDLVDY